MYYPLVLFPALYLRYEDALADGKVVTTPSCIDALTIDGGGFNGLYDMDECITAVLAVLGTDDPPNYGVVHEDTFIPLGALTHMRSWFESELDDIDEVIRMVKAYPNGDYPTDRNQL